MSIHRRLYQFLSSIVILILMFSSLSLSSVFAQGDIQTSTPNCPRYEPNLLKDKEFLHSLPVECIKIYKDLSRRANTSDIEAMAAGGPDSFGYTYDDTVAYSWISAETNSGLTGEDEFSGPIDIGFDFPFYGLPQSQLYFSTNGLITFGQGRSEWSGPAIPADTNPNNFIAPFWDDLEVGSPFNNGAIYYSQGGNEPNRYFLIEYRDVTLFYSTPAFTFETILYENGDIVFQYQSLPDPRWPSIGIEDQNGYDGLEYPYWNLQALQAVRFSYPAPAARVFLSPESQVGGFAPINGYKDFEITVANSGGLGADTYDVKTISSDWSIEFYASDGVTPLTDTDGDSFIDTGPLAPGTSMPIIVRFNTPDGAQIGDQNSSELVVKSSLDPLKMKFITLGVSVPANFVNVFDDEADGAMSLMTITSAGTATHKAVADDYFGFDVTTISTTGGEYLYAWSKFGSTDLASWVDIEYMFLNHKGTITVPVKKLTNNSSSANATLHVRDSSPAVAMAPNGTIGIVWTHYLHNYSTDKFNYNIYFATLDASGNRLTGPTNLTNNTTWSANADSTMRRFYYPVIAASDDNRFIMSWEVDRPGTFGGRVYDLWYAVRSSAGVSILAPAAFTHNDMSWSPVLNSLTGGKVMLTWATDLIGPYYAVINSNGTIAKAETSLATYADHYSTPDGVLLPNGKVALAWPSESSNGDSCEGVELAVLDSSYNIQNSESFACSPWHPSYANGESVSVTTDSASHVIMTWTGPNNWLFYALGDSNGTFISDPIIYKTGGDYIDINYKGQGNARYQAGYPIRVTMGGVAQGTYNLLASENWRQSYSGANNGPIKVESTNGKKIVASERVAYSPDGGTSWTSYSELMGMPVGQLTSSYVFPWYNNVDVNSQLRFGNAGAASTTVTVTVGGQIKGTYNLAPNASQRVSYKDLNAGPVKVTSSNNVPIIASMRVAYTPDNVTWTSFSEIMGLPSSKLTTSYIFPWYNNIDLNTQLRFGNVGTAKTTVTVTIGGAVRGTYDLNPNQSTRVSYPNVNSGPVKLTSSDGVPIIASIRVAYFANNAWTDFSEMMGSPTSSLSTNYSFPVYNNVDHNTQLRVGNAGTNNTMVTVTVGGVVQGTYSLVPNQSTRLSYAGLDTGPVVIQSSGNVPIIASERVAYYDSNISKWTSFAEMMGLPREQLTTSYLFPWYNNVDLDTQLRFGVP